MEQHYRTLGLRVGAPAQDIRAAYKALALRLHPDKNPGGEEAFSRLQVAYEFLSDPKNRERAAAPTKDPASAPPRAWPSDFGRPARPPCNVSDILEKDAQMMGLGGGMRGGARELLRRRRVSSVSLAHLLREQAMEMGVPADRAATRADWNTSPRPPPSEAHRRPHAPDPAAGADLPCQSGGRGSAMRAVYQKLVSAEPRIALDPTLRWCAAWETLSAEEEARRQRVMCRILGSEGASATDERRYRAFVVATTEVLRGRRNDDSDDVYSGRDSEGTGGSSIRASWLKQHRKHRGCSDPLSPPRGPTVLDAATADACHAQANQYRQRLMAEFRERQRARAAAP